MEPLSSRVFLLGFRNNALVSWFCSSELLGLDPEELEWMIAYSAIIMNEYDDYLLNEFSIA